MTTLDPGIRRDRAAAGTAETAPATPGEVGAGAGSSPGRTHPRCPTGLAVLGAAFVLWGLLLGLRALRDNSFLTHLATGRLLFERGGIPRSDPYSFTAHGDPWTVQSWLASALYAAVEKVGGMGGVRLLIAVTAALLAGLVWRLTRPAGTVLGRVLVAGLAVGVGTGMWVERPYLFGLVLFAVLLLVAEGGADPRWLVPVMWIWVNTHGSFPLGLAALVALAVGRRLDGDHPRRELSSLGWATVGVLLGAVNPLGPRLLVFPLGPLQQPEKFRDIVEWRAPTYHAPFEKLFVLQLVVAALLLLRRRRWRIAIPGVLFAAAALTSLRNVPVASLALVPGMAAGAQGLGEILGRQRSRLALGAAVVLGLVAAVVAVCSLRRPAADLYAYPVAATAWMHERGMIGVDARVVTADWVGNYLEYRYGPDDARVFMDDRVDMYPASVVRDYLTVSRARPGWETVLRRRRIDAVLWRRSTVLGRRLGRSPHWRIVHRAHGWVVAVPTSPS